ncbi:hypothetical protein FACS1894154_02790 [Betaproteobacteria bacterium]|nr:hypothetical protein FACS1894154_02790 [Betaproteobacteria bacterium]
MQDQQNAQRILNQLTQKGEIDFPPLDQRAEQLAAAGQTRLAIELYQNWIQHHPGHVHLVDAWFALGSTLSNGITQGSIPSNHQNLAQVRDAYICARDIYSSTARLRYDQYLNLLELYVALGSLYAKLDDKQKALEQWNWVINHADPKNPEALRMLAYSLSRVGDIYFDDRQMPQALNAKKLSLDYAPEQPKTIGDLISVRQMTCLWPIDAPLTKTGANLSLSHTNALYTLSFSDDPELQLAAARKTALQSSQQPAASSQQPAASSQQPAASSQQPAASSRYYIIITIVFVSLIPHQISAITY